MIEPRLVLCSGAEEPPGSPLLRGRRILKLDSLGPGANITIKIEDITRAFVRDLPDRLVDLLEIASYVYAADFAMKRGGAWSDDESTEPWDRDFLFVIPVRDVDFWDSDAVKQVLVDTLEFVSGGQARRHLRSFAPCARGRRRAGRSFPKRR